MRNWSVGKDAISIFHCTILKSAELLNFSPFIIELICELQFCEFSVHTLRKCYPTKAAESIQIPNNRLVMIYRASVYREAILNLFFLAVTESLRQQRAQYCELIWTVNWMYRYMPTNNACPIPRSCFLLKINVRAVRETEATVIDC